MPELIHNCPRCTARKTTFEVKSVHVVRTNEFGKPIAEMYSVCRGCRTGVVFIAQPAQAGSVHADIMRSGFASAGGNIDHLIEILGYVSVKDVANRRPPEHLPQPIEAAFKEGAACLAIGCYNAAATMFRLCIDLATRPLLPEENVDGLNGRIRFSLGLRLTWLFDTNRLPRALQDLSDAVKDDGNAGAHEGTLGEADAEDILDFATALLERLFTEPKRLDLAKQRREARRS